MAFATAHYKIEHIGDRRMARAFRTEPAMRTEVLSQWHGEIGQNAGPAQRNGMVNQFGAHHRFASRRPFMERRAESHTLSCSRCSRAHCLTESLLLTVLLQPTQSSQLPSSTATAAFLSPAAPDRLTAMDRVPPTNSRRGRTAPSVKGAQCAHVLSHRPATVAEAMRRRLHEDDGPLCGRDFDAGAEVGAVKLPACPRQPAVVA